MSASGGMKRDAKAEKGGGGAKKKKKKARVEPEGLAEEIKIYDELALTRDFKRAWCAPAPASASGASDLSILLSASQRNVPQNKQRRTLIPVVASIGEDGQGLAPQALGGFPVPEDCLLVERSPSGRLVLFARSSKDAAGGEAKGGSVVWELCTNDGQVIKQTHVPSALHGPVSALHPLSRWFRASETTSETSTQCSTLLANCNGSPRLN